ncbi:hypothetical protein P8452_62468 [Trifolium repens]|nr:hypothetical protein P8452_62468 [Trifolium repens]
MIEGHEIVSLSTEEKNSVSGNTGLRHIHTLSFTIWFCSQGIIMIIYQTKKRDEGSRDHVMVNAKIIRTISF